MSTNKRCASCGNMYQGDTACELIDDVEAFRGALDRPVLDYETLKEL